MLKFTTIITNTSKRNVANIWNFLNIKSVVEINFINQNPVDHIQTMLEFECHENC